MNQKGRAAIGRRRNGNGGIELDAARDRHRGHYSDASGKRVRLPWCDCRADAEQQLQAAIEMATETANVSGGGGVTLRSWGKDFLDARELEGHRASSDDRHRWKYIVRADFIDWPIASISRRDVKRWMGQLNVTKTYGRGRPKKSERKKIAATRTLAWQTKAHALNLLRQAFVRAIDDEIVDDAFANPCIGLKFKRPPTTETPTNFFFRPEIERLQQKAPLNFRPLIEFAIATGLRQGEMRALRDVDVHAEGIDVPYITVRYGMPPKKPTKSGHVREIPLLPMALRALREWYELRKTLCTENDKGLTFPAARGGYRSEGKILGRRHQEIWRKLLADIGVRRHLVWHDLRHTCGTALLGGYFGRQWRMEEIRQFLGHADIEMTQRYAHALQTTLNEAARETCGDILPKKKTG